MPQVMDAGQAAGGNLETGRAKELPESLREAGASVGAGTPTAIAQERGVASVRQSPARLEIVLHFAGGIVGQRNQTGLVELGGADRESALGPVVVGKGEADELAASETGRIEQDHGKPEHFAAKRRIGMRW
jgi:hypothetical protein